VKDESAFLIERTGLDRPYWLCGPAPGYIHGTQPFVFSADANDAIRFARERDAWELAAYFGDVDLTVTEHLWSAP
jgi:hypothetical protein